MSRDVLRTVSDYESLALHHNAAIETLHLPFPLVSSVPLADSSVRHYLAAVHIKQYSSRRHTDTSTYGSGVAMQSGKVRAIAIRRRDCF